MTPLYASLERAPVADWNTLRSPAWEKLAATNEAVDIYPPYLVSSSCHAGVTPRTCPLDIGYVPLAYFAATHHLRFNSGFFARRNQRADPSIACDEFLAAVDRGETDPRAIYVVRPTPAKSFFDEHEGQLRNDRRPADLFWSAPPAR